MTTKKHKYFIVTFLIVACLAAYGRIVTNDFVNFDDPQYITENNHIKSGINPDSIKWAFTSTTMSNWHPITWIFHMVNWGLFGDNPSGHHFVSLLLHIGVCILLFLFLHKTTNNLWSAAFATSFFALHPLRAESVAWAAELKDVLSMFFGLASIYTYAFYAESSKRAQYFLCLALFALSLMSKPMLVTLPFALLLLDYWPLGRWQKALAAPKQNRAALIGRLVWEKVPFIFLTILSSIVTFWAQYSGGAITSIDRLSFSQRLANIIISYVAYLGEIFLPSNLAVFYPYEYFLQSWQIIFSLFFLIVITGAALYAIKKLPFLFFGWFWYLGTLIPVIGLVQVGAQAIADRYTYLPSVGIAVILTWGTPLFFQKFKIRKKILIPLALAFICTLVVSTWMQCGFWKNSIILWNHSLQVTKDNHLARNNRGNAHIALGDFNKATIDFNEAIRLRPDFVEAFYSRGVVYIKQGHIHMAIQDFNEAIRLKPDYAKAYNNRGVAYLKLRNHQKAILDLDEALRLKPDYAEAYYNRGVVYAVLKQYAEAIKDVNQYILLKPDNTGAYMIRGDYYFNQGNYELACRDYQLACSMGLCKKLDWDKYKEICR